MSKKEIDLESITLEIQSILNRIHNANYFLEECVENVPEYMIDKKPTPTQKKTSSLMLILLDYIVINLYKFFEIKGKLRHIEESTYPNHDISKSIAPIFDEIAKVETRVRQWRNKIAAHSHDQSESYIPYFKRDKKYLETYKDVIFASRLIFWSMIIFYKHLPDLRISVSIKTKLFSKEENDFKIKQWWPEMKKTELEIIRQTNSKLQKNGFEPLPSTFQDSIKDFYLYE